MKEVIIKVYIEKEAAANKRRTTPFPTLSHRKRLPPPPLPALSHRKRPLPPPRGFDRRAELLAYTQKLRRNAGNSSPSKKTTTKNYNNKKWRWSSLSFPKINLPFRPRSNRKWRYEAINTEDYDNNNTGSSCCGQNMKRNIRFCEKFKSFIKELSCTGYRCIG